MKDSIREADRPPEEERHREVVIAPPHTAEIATDLREEGRGVNHREDHRQGGQAGPTLDRGAQDEEEDRAEATDQTNEEVIGERAPGPAEEGLRTEHRRSHATSTKLDNAARARNASTIMADSPNPRTEPSENRAGDLNQIQQPPKKSDKEGSSALLVTLHIHLGAVRETKTKRQKKRRRTGKTKR